MAKCHICGGKEDVIMGECSRCREILADQKTDKEIEDIWTEVGQKLEMAYSKGEFDEWA